MKNYVVALSILLLTVGTIGCGKQEEKEMPGMKLETEAPEQQAVYTCPMHPEVQSDKPGKCPKCGMNLEIKK
jgi:rubrerythrin